MAILLCVFVVVVGAAILDRNNRIANHTDEAVGASIGTEIAVGYPEYADNAAAEAALKTGKNPNRAAIKNVATVFSFGAKDSQSDDAYGGFKRVYDTITWITANPPATGTHMTYAAGGQKTFYLDKTALETLPGTYVLTIDKTKTLNVFWKEYYQEAMDKAKVMIFLITEGWLMRKNCWEELIWATTKRNKKANRLFLLDDAARTAYGPSGQKANEMFNGLAGSTYGLTETDMDKTLSELFLKIGETRDVQGTTAGNNLMTDLMKADKGAAKLGKYVLGEDSRVTRIETSVQLGLTEVHP